MRCSRAEAALAPGPVIPLHPHPQTVAPHDAVIDQRGACRAVDHEAQRFGTPVQRHGHGRMTALHPHRQDVFGESDASAASGAASRTNGMRRKAGLRSDHG